MTSPLTGYNFQCFGFKWILNLFLQPAVFIWLLGFSFAVFLVQGSSSLVFWPGGRQLAVRRVSPLASMLPGNIPPLKPTDLLTAYRAQDPSNARLKSLLYESQKQSKGDYVLVNTFEELEGRAQGCSNITVFERLSCLGGGGRGKGGGYRG